MQTERNRGVRCLRWLGQTTIRQFLFSTPGFGGSGFASSCGGRTPQPKTLPNIPMAKPHQPTVLLTTPNQLNAISTVPTAQKYQEILFRFIRALCGPTSNRSHVRRLVRRQESSGNLRNLLSYGAGECSRNIGKASTSRAGSSLILHSPWVYESAFLVCWQ